MIFKTRWCKQMQDSLRLSGEFKDLSEKELHEVVLKIFDKHFTDQPALIYNDYEEEVMKTSLAQCLDWIEAENPTIAESGVFFYQKSKKRNLNVEIIKEEMLDARSKHKKEMFQARKAGDVILEMVKKNQQLNDKKAANSGYGAEGQSSSFLYNAHSAMSVTASGRGQLSTACQCNENLMADSVKFMNMDEFFVYVRNILSDRHTWAFNVDDVIDIIPTKKMFMERMIRKFKRESYCNKDLVESVWENLDREEKIRVYYKSNLRIFLLNKKVTDIYRKIVTCGEPLVNPNNVPEKMQKWVYTLTDLTTEFVNYRHGVFRYEDRTKFEKRAATPVMDELIA